MEGGAGLDFFFGEEIFLSRDSLAYRYSYSKLLKPEEISSTGSLVDIALDNELAAFGELFRKLRISSFMLGCKILLLSSEEKYSFKVLFKASLSRSKFMNFSVSIPLSCSSNIPGDNDKVYSLIGFTSSESYIFTNIAAKESITWPIFRFPKSFIIPKTYFPILQC